MTIASVTLKPAPLPVDDPIQQTIIEYPDSDGEPMGETGIHVRATLALYSALYDLFRLRGWSDLYIAADMFLYYEKGNPRAQKAPDVMVIKGVDGSYERRSFKIWEEGAAPAVIFEITSKSTWVEDLVNKSDLYKQLGVKEYFIFDPLAEFLSDPFQGMRLVGKDYVPLKMDADGALWSEELGLKLRRDGDMLRVIDPEDNTIMPVFGEIAQVLVAAEQRAEREAQRAETAESEVERLQAMIEQLQTESSQ